MLVATINECHATGGLSLWDFPDNATLAAMNKCLAQNNKPGRKITKPGPGAKATKKRNRTSPVTSRARRLPPHNPSERKLPTMKKKLALATVVAVGALGLWTAQPANAQTATISSPTIVCDTPAGVGCNGSKTLPPGKYRVLSTHNLSGKGSCQVSGPNGSGYVLC